jgi:cytochrome P450
MQLFCDEMRRDPFPMYATFRASSPLLHDPQSGLWLVFDYDGVKRLLSDHGTFSSKYGPDWLIFTDPPRHSKLRALVSQAFTPRSVANLEPRIRELARELLDKSVEHGAMDLALDFAIPLPMMVIAEMLGIPPSDWDRFRWWSDVILKMSYTIGRRDEEAARAGADFAAVTTEMDRYLVALVEERRRLTSDPLKDDLLTRLVSAEVDGERLTQAEILGFFQLLLLAGSETTTNLINNAILCFVENPDQFALLQKNMDLLPSAIEEVLRYRSPLQWMYRVPNREVELHDRNIPAGSLVLAVIGSANRDPRQFPDADRFDIERDPNAHLAFGHGIHFCLGAPLARLEARIALTELFQRIENISLASDQPWEPRKGLHVLGPTRLPIRFEPRRRAAGVT